MTRSRLIFFLFVLAIVIAIWKSHTQPTPKTATGSGTVTAISPTVAPVANNNNNSLIVPATAPSAAVMPSASPAIAHAQAAPDFKKTAERITPAVVALSIFDVNGKLLRNGTGFFVSPDGRLVTSRSIVDGGAHAVATTADGKIYNVLGVLAEAEQSDAAILKAEVKDRVPFIFLNKTAPFDAGAHIAAVGSPQNKKKDVIAQTTIADRKSDGQNEWLELTTPIPGESLGAPVITEKGDVLGLIALQRGDGPAVNVVRLAGALDPVFGHIDEKTKPSWASVSPEAPAEGPLNSPTPPPARKRIVYNPFPRYPSEARRFFNPITASGKYRVRFSKDGRVSDVAVLQSTQNQAMDNAALQALRQWKAEPGQEWTAFVPITFQP